LLKKELREKFGKKEMCDCVGLGGWGRGGGRLKFHLQRLSWLLECEYTYKLQITTVDSDVHG